MIEDRLFDVRRGNEKKMRGKKRDEDLEED